MRDTKNSRMKPFTFRLPAQLREHLFRLAQKGHEAPSNLVRRLLEDFVTSQR